MGTMAVHTGILPPAKGAACSISLFRSLDYQLAHL